jgi:hypothetical protein
MQPDLALSYLSNDFLSSILFELENLEFTLDTKGKQKCFHYQLYRFPKEDLDIHPLK